MTQEVLTLIALASLAFSIALGIIAYVAYLVFVVWARLWREYWGRA